MRTNTSSVQNTVETGSISRGIELMGTANASGQ